MSSGSKCKFIKDLQSYEFYIPAYQRGYRWTPKEVKYLLDDIEYFNENNHKNDYCLQSLIVKQKKRW